MAERTHVTCCRDDRLGARLRNFLYALEFSERIGAQLTVNWSPTAGGLGQEGIASDHDQYHFFDLFEEEAFRKRHSDVDITCLTHREQQASALAEKQAFVSKIGFHPISHFSETHYSKIYYDTTHPYYFSSHPEPCGAISSLFMGLPLHPNVAAALNQAVAKHCVEDALCLHVRRGDIMEITRLPEDRKAVINKFRLVQARHFTFKYAPYEAYQKSIEALGSSKPIVVFSDDAAVKARFRADYGDRCINYNTILDALPLTIQQRDFVELLLISRCGESVGLRSAFVELATQISGKKLHSIHPFIDPAILIRDVDNLIGTSEATRPLHTYILKEFSARFAKYGLLDTMKAIDSYLESMA